ncbi:MAG: hypothetical protein V8Q84_09795 [Bilophila sp.]
MAHGLRAHGRACGRQGPAQRQPTPLCDGKPVIDDLDGVWNPTFSPDGSVLLFCSLKDGVFSRHTVRL